MKANQIFEVVTDRIIAHLESGVSPWIKPWATDPTLEWPKNPTTGKRYNGFNALCLNLFQAGHGSNLWMTYIQSQEAGGQVRKGEKGVPILRPFQVTKTFNDASTGEEEEASLTFFKGHTVFNLDQIDGLEHLLPAQPIAANPIELWPGIEEAITRTGAWITHGGNKCFYDPSVDRITMVEAPAFQSAEHYYGTKLHELVHWTGHKDRLGRFPSDKPQDKKEYGFEELVAEIGAGFLCQHFRVDGIDRHQADYIGGWLAIIKEDKKAILRAASKAQRAFEHIIPEAQP